MGSHQPRYPHEKTSNTHKASTGYQRIRKAATLASLAAELGVSRTTVSNAYNRPDQLSPQLRERVLEAARRLGYPGPDPLARSLRTRKAGAIGLLFTEALSFAFRDPAAVLFFEGLASACEDAATGLLLVPSTPGKGVDVALAAQAPVDGFVAYSLPRADPQLVAALGRPVPTVVVDEPLELAEVDWVGIDDFAAARSIGDHLRGLGHRRVGIICTRTGQERHDGLVSLQRQRDSDYDVLRLRLDGVCAGLELRRDAVPVVECWDQTIDAGEVAAHSLLDAVPDVTAIACTTDMLALGALQAARARGLSVPDQLSVTGFDDVPVAREIDLTTVAQPHAEKGRAAWEVLTREDHQHRARRTLNTELVVRGTTARPAP